MHFLKNCELSFWDIKNGFELDRATALVLIQFFSHLLIYMYYSKEPIPNGTPTLSSKFGFIFI